ncbi:hypothetical protein CBR_g48616 [Chara braunii]|uniref:DNA polymerase n=1 Tax=Chara braunii TaxID=69332 RepID=A0A388M344_CHABU|nr:hypothetical protein CBR_g48616 [Chara braunii]|eukprot:GBG89007.1 hypothetical protein CBR_g48616 [Chara braunii]
MPTLSLEPPVTHVLASGPDRLRSSAKAEDLERHSCVMFLRYEWIEDSLKEGKLMPPDPYRLIVHNTSIEKSLTSSTTTTATVAVGCLQMLIAPIAGPQKLNHKGKEESGALGEVVSSMIGKEGKQKKGRGGESDSEEERTKEEDCRGDILTRYLGTTAPAAADALEPCSTSLNTHITRILWELHDLYEGVLDDGNRALIYRKVASEIDKLSYKVTSASQLDKMEGIGQSTRVKIKEILRTGKLEMLEVLLANPKVSVLQLFMSVWGIGPKTATEMYNRGYRTLEDLKRESSLERMPRLGLKYYADILQRIPRVEAVELEKVVVGVAKELYPGVLAQATGSFRRGKASCGDIDFVISHPDGNSHRGLLAKLVARLTDIQFISDGLQDRSRGPQAPGHYEVDTYMGLCKLQGARHYRRIDIKVYPIRAHPFGLLHFTGNDIFNRRIRELAKKKGYKLNDHGLFPTVGEGQNIRSGTESIPCATEREILEKLGMPYLEPHERNW